MRPTVVFLLSSAGLLSTFGVACGGGPGAGDRPPPGKASANPHYGAPGARIAILSPSRGATVGPRVRVRVRVEGFRLDGQRVNQAPQRGSGHIHFRLDDGRYERQRYTGADGRLAARSGVSGKYSPSPRTTLTYADLPPGEHRLTVSLANNDMSETGVRASTTFRVR